MSSRRQIATAYEIPKRISKASERVHLVWLRGRVTESAKLRRKLIRQILAELELEPKNTRLWCLLGDLYTFTRKRLAVYRRALRTNLVDAEANAELAELYADLDDARYAACFDRAVQHCRGIDIEESIIYTALEAARKAKDQDRIKKATRVGRRRFPDSSLFETE